LLEIVFLDLSAKGALDVCKELLFFFCRNERDGFTVGFETTSSADSVHVFIRLNWHVEVDDEIHLLDIDTSAEQVC
jgi:hypothetical protein